MVKSLDEFCVPLHEFPVCDLMPGGVLAVRAGEKRQAIGFGREGEEISRDPKDILLEQLGLRRAIGFNREDELIKNGPTGKERAVGFGKENEPPANPPKRGNPVGFNAISKARENSR